MQSPMYVFTSQQRCLLELSANIWHRRGAAKSCGLRFNEETATEVLLLDLARQFPGSVRVIPFTHSEEAQFGADWAWAFVGPDGRTSQGMLVQAKRLDDRDLEYRELFKQGRPVGTGSLTFQIDRLIASARHFGLPPIYAFYNHLKDPTRVPQESCGTLYKMANPLPKSWGVAIASAIKVRDAWPVKTYDCHRLHSRPLHCLLCSQGIGLQGSLGSAGAAAEALSRLFEGTGIDDRLGPDLVPPFEPTSELPALFQEAVKIDRMRETGGDAGLADRTSEFPGIAGVVIMQDSEDKEIRCDTD